ncbi:hypothetical protein D9M71_749300 [compost metagenome]
MRIEQQRIAELGLQSRQFLLQGAVVWRPDLLQISRALIGRRLQPFAEQRNAVEQRCRVQAGGRAHVQRLVVGRSVKVDDEPRVLGRQGACTQFRGEVV